MARHQQHPGRSRSAVQLQQRPQSSVPYGRPNGGLSQYSSWAYGGNSNGIYGISEPYATAMAAGFATNAPPYPLAPSVDNFGPHNGGPSTVNVAVSASHWFCDIFLNNSYSAFDEDSDITHLNSPFEPEAGGVNTNGVGVGAVVNTNTWAAQPIALVGNKVVTLPGTGYGAAINNFAIVTAGSPPLTNPAPQIVGNDGAGDGSLWDYTAPNGTNTTVYVPKVLSQYLYPPATNAPTWTVTGTSGINDAGAIIGVATSSADNQSHGVLLLPCQFRLLNGSTNMGDVDGLDFSGNRATTISATASYTTPAFIATNVAANAGTNVLGVDTPLGYGRPAYLQAGNCDIYSLILLAKVSPSIAATITYGWNRTVQERAVVITSTNTNTWYVTAIPYPTQPYPDHPSTNYETSVPSTNNNVVAIYDNPGIYIPDFVGAGASTIGDYAYDKKTFIYSLTNSIGATNAIATQQVGCYLVARRVNITGSTVADWTNVTSISSTTNIPDCSSVTTNEIRAIVSPSTNLIMLDPSCTSNYPP